MRRSRRRRSTRVGAILGAAAALALPAPPAQSSDPRDAPSPGPIRFQELSTLSGGPYGFGSPRATVEKATCAFFDADGDGWDDFVSLAGVGEPSLYFLNRDDGAGGRTFVPAPAGNGLDTGPCLDRDGTTLAAGDVDADGDVDLFVGFGWNSTIPVGYGQNVLLLNDGTGRFRDATAEVGISDGDNTTCASFFFDMDLDGDLDLFVCNSKFTVAGKDGDAKAHLWRNELAETGVLRFVDEVASRGPDHYEIGGVWCATGVDYDGDGDGDILIGHDAPVDTQLFRNDGTGNFDEVTKEVGAGEGDDQGVPPDTTSSFGNDSHAAMGIAWGDVENDGDLDLYITNVARNPLYRNNGDGTFTEVGERAGVRAAWVTWGTSFADFDLDGYVDLYVAGGDLWDLSRAVVQSFLFRNRGDGTFDDATATANLRRDVPLHRENGTACADFDGDGRVDLLVSRAERTGASPYLYRNETETAGRRWLAVTLRGNGATSNTSAIGARVRVIPKDASGAPIPGLAQLREINGGDSRGAVSSFTQHFGLGASAVSADVVVTWPRAGTIEERTQTYVGVPPDLRVTITEDPRPASWVLHATAVVPVPDGRTTSFVCPASGTPDPLATVAVTSGPAWVSAGGWDGGRTIRVEAPRVDVAEETTVTVVAAAQGADSGPIEQTLTLQVVPAPRVEIVRRSAGRALLLAGDHLEIRGITVLVDGVPCKAGRGRTRRAKPGKPASQVRITLPRALAKLVRKGPHTVVVTDPATGLGSAFGF